MNRSPYNDHHSGLERRMHCSVLAFPTDHKTESYGKICSTQAIVKEIQQNTKDVNYPSLCLPPYSPLSGNLARHSVQLVAQSCPTLCDPMDYSSPGFPVHHQLLELIQTHIHRVGDAIQTFSVVHFSFHLQSFPTSESFQWDSSSHQIAKVLKFKRQHQSF